MGYSTDFDGKFTISPALPETLDLFFGKLNHSRRMKRNIDAQYGFEGEFYVEDNSNGVLDHNSPSQAQPGLWCQWLAQGDSMQWDGGEKFYCYEDWLYYIINRILKPLGHTVNGTVTWSGEETDDIGTLIVVNNVLFVVRGAHIEDKEEFDFYFKKGKAAKYESTYTQFVDSLEPLVNNNNKLEGGSIKLLN